MPAAGHGSRMAADLPKQYLKLDQRTVAEHSVARLLDSVPLQALVVVVAADDPLWPQLPVASRAGVVTAFGGPTRAESVLNGLAALPGAGDHDWVLVHDMARPCVRAADIRRLIEECGSDGAILAAPVADTLKQSDGSRILATLDRSTVWRALTPQLFPVGALRAALQTALQAGAEITDEASAMERAGWQPRLVAGAADNIKITWPADLPLARFFLAQQQQEHA
ncbi:2-C-methyl-D-erythritol 4-phosphate cytidylyltransferase [Isoalcanivorax beigongshangi]|uniref:2-C-methyl-D-erythritol 4-phosphate cytidylyltransferase n=1 Tax=Isoalcanivorax beigongshangi TaxID=3238810 RepID=A0ABV4AF79_9GAMM